MLESCCTIRLYHVALKWPPSGWSHSCLGWDYWQCNCSNLSCFKQKSKGISEVRFRCFSQIRLSLVLVTVLPGLVRGEASLSHLVAHPAQDKSCFFHHGPPAPPRHALQPLAQLLGASAPLRCEGWHAPASQFFSRPIQTHLIHLQLSAKVPNVHDSQNLYAGNCETVFLQKLGLVMSFLTTDPCMCHSSRARYTRSQQSSSHCVFCQPRPRCCWA